MSGISHAHAHGSVLAVVVAYEPDVALLDAVLSSVAGQVGEVLVFDNGSRKADVAGCVAGFGKRGIGNVALHSSPTNVGIASAINAGFESARMRGFSHVLILDQDSTVDAGMVAALMRALVENSGNGVPVAAVGPQFEDRRTGSPAPFVKIGPLFNRKIFPLPDDVVEADFLISSGALIPITVIDDIGGMDDALFIDNVDLEWSFRARHRGYRLLGVGNARMGHAIGDKLRSVNLPGFTLDISLHGPVRQYYMTRNRITLYGRAETPWAWVTQDVPRLLTKFLGMSLFVAPRLRNCRYMLRGARDALLGRLGPFRG